MIRYTVVWPGGAQDELAELWIAASDRSAVAAAANDIDVELSEDAAAKGEQLSEGLRALFAPPLRVLFAVREDDRVVEVLRVRHL